MCGEKRGRHTGAHWGTLGFQVFIELRWDPGWQADTQGQGQRQDLQQKPSEERERERAAFLTTSRNSVTDLERWVAQVWFVQFTVLCCNSQYFSISKIRYLRKFVSLHVKYMRESLGQPHLVLHLEIWPLARWGIHQDCNSTTFHNNNVWSSQI